MPILFLAAIISTGKIIKIFLIYSQLYLHYTLYLIDSFPPKYEIVESQIYLKPLLDIFEIKYNRFWILFLCYLHQLLALEIVEKSQEVNFLWMFIRLRCKKLCSIYICIFTIFFALSLKYSLPMLLYLKLYKSI